MKVSIAMREYIIKAAIVTMLATAALHIFQEEYKTGLTMLLVVAQGALIERLLRMVRNSQQMARAAIDECAHLAAILRATAKQNEKEG